jgi:fucose permease
MDKKQLRRSIIISCVVILITLANFSRLSGTENFRAIHIVTLLVCGMGIGVLLVNVIQYYKLRKS